MANRFGTTIPDPQATVASLLKTVQALKNVVEGTAGQRGVVGGAPQTYYQRDVPQDPRIGDTWVRPSNRQVTNKPAATTNFFYYDGVVTSIWDGAQWVVTSVNGEYWELYPGATDIPLNNTAAFLGVMATPLFGGRDQIWLVTWRAMLLDTAGIAVFETIMIDPDAPATYDTQSTAAAFPNIGYPLQGTFVVETGDREGIRLAMYARDQTSVNGAVVVNYTTFDTSFKSTYMRGIRIG